MRRPPGHPSLLSEDAWGKEASTLMPFAKLGPRFAWEAQKKMEGTLLAGGPLNQYLLPYSLSFSFVTISKKKGGVFFAFSEKERERGELVDIYQDFLQEVRLP